MRPLARVGQDGVHVAEVAERGVGGVSINALQACHEVRSLGNRAEQLTLEAGVREDCLQVLDCRPLPAGRIDRVEADQTLKELGGTSGELSAPRAWSSAGSGERLRDEPACACDVSLSSHASDATPPGKPGTLGQAASNSWV
jgi:hypothetical protein